MVQKATQLLAGHKDKNLLQKLPILEYRRRQLIEAYVKVNKNFTTFPAFGNPRNRYEQNEKRIQMINIVLELRTKSSQTQPIDTGVIHPQWIDAEYRQMNLQHSQ